jgi:homogentisate 1,2-dioxygenase
MVIVQTCPGSRLDWPVDVGPFMETFPFHRIGIQSGSLSFNVEIHDHGTKIIAFSKACTGEARLDGCCSHCVKIPAEVQKLVDLAVQADSRVNHRYLSWKQIQALLADRTEEVRRWRLKVSLVDPR